MRRFNTTGLCIPKKHYMVDISSKLDSIEKLIDDESYFVINRPRQFGKTTTLNELYKRLKVKYTVIKLDFERMSEDFISTKVFCDSFVESLERGLGEELKKVQTLNNLAYLISDITKDRDIILMIDEVDRISNNQLFVNFLGVLRSLYLDREAELCTTFKSVILAGVYDIKNLKLKFSDSTDTRYNSPWNIAVDFEVTMNFNVEEISTMLDEYGLDNNLNMDIYKLSEEIYKFTSGYPFLVSRICQIVDEKIIEALKRAWEVNDIHKAVKILLSEHNTLFDDLIKNLENNKELYSLIESILIKETKLIYEFYNPEISVGTIFGYLSKDENNYVVVSNKIFSELIFNYMTSKIDTSIMSDYNIKSKFETKDGGLDIKEVLLSFQKFMKSARSVENDKFLETDGRLIFLAFIKPIINGTGFAYKEVQISDNKRLDVVIQYNHFKYIIEMKRWSGNKYHEEGKVQLYDYLDIEGLTNGYLLVFNFNKNREYKSSEYMIEDKEIFEVFV